LEPEAVAVVADITVDMVALVVRALLLLDILLNIRQPQVQALPGDT
jgi:hypothetical protein